MNDLLEFTINAHGGLEKWNSFNSITARLKVGGMTWVRKQQPNLLDDAQVTVNTKKQFVSFEPVNAAWHSAFETNRVAVVSGDGHVIEELKDPRASFAGHKRETPWSRLQALYFSSYAIWIYFNAPFCFADPAYTVNEIEPWEENGELFRRLQVQFPDSVATHSRIQTFYIDKTGLIRRHDYNVEISDNVASAHYVYDHTTVQGIKIPTRRRVFFRKDDNTSLQPEPIFVSIDISDLKLQ